jgi:hypothetical protein
MELRQTFRFSAQSETLVEEFLRGLGEVADLDEKRERFLFKNKTGELPFQFHCVIVQGGIDAERTGDFFKFLGVFVEALTSAFGTITVGNA